jgi:hypothetical protein
MLIPLTRKTLDDVIPIVATGDQYKYCWGKLPNFLQRLSISIVCVMAIALIDVFAREALGWFEFVLFLIGAIAGTYWLWSPIYLAGKRNRNCRQYQYGGYWQGEVLDVFVTDVVVGKSETVNKYGELVVRENREELFNLEIGDELGFSTIIKVPLKAQHRAVRPGDSAEMIVLSNRRDLGRINWISDVYVPDCNQWISDYPYVRRDAFTEVSRKLR